MANMILVHRLSDGAPKELVVAHIVSVDRVPAVPAVQAAAAVPDQWVVANGTKTLVPGTAAVAASPASPESAVITLADNTVLAVSETEAQIQAASNA